MIMMMNGNYMMTIIKIDGYEDHDEGGCDSTKHLRSGDGKIDSNVDVKCTCRQGKPNIPPRDSLAV